MPTQSKITVQEAQWESKQPEELDYLRPNGFRFIIQSLPKVTYFCQAANLPSLDLGFATQPTPFLDISKPGEKITFGDLIIKFMIQKDMSNYIELYNWIIGLGFPENHSQFRDRQRSQAFRNPDNSVVTYADGTPALRTTDALDFSDAVLMVLDGNRNPIVRLNFVECFPTSLSGVEFDITTGDPGYFTAQAVFKYRHFTIETL